MKNASELKVKIYKLEVRILNERAEKETCQLKKELLLAQAKVKELQAEMILKQIK